MTRRQDVTWSKSIMALIEGEAWDGKVSKPSPAVGGSSRSAAKEQPDDQESRGTEVSDTVENLFYGESREYRMWGIF